MCQKCHESGLRLIGLLIRGAAIFVTLASSASSSQVQELSSCHFGPIQQYYGDSPQHSEYNFFVDCIRKGTPLILVV